MSKARVLIGTFILDFTWGATFLYMTFDIYSKGSYLMYGLVRGLPAIAYFLGSRFLGYLSDSYNGRKFVLLLSSISTFLALFLMYLTPELLWIIVATVWYFLSPYEVAAVPYLSEEVGEGEASGEFYASGELGFTVGSLIGGVMSDTLGIRPLFLAASLLALTSLPLFLGVEGNLSLPRKGFLEALSYTIKPEFPGETKKLVLPFLLSGSAISMFFAAFSLKLFEASGRSNTLIGVLMAVAGLMGTVAAPLYGKMVDRVGALRSFLISCVIYSAYFLIGALVSDLVALSALMVIPLFPLHYNAKVALSMKLSNGMESTAVSTAASMGSISEAVGNYVGGALMSVLGVDPVMSLAGAIMLVSLLGLTHTDLFNRSE